MNPQSPRILVVGATGMLGDAVYCRLSLHAGWRVRATQRRNPAEPEFLDARDRSQDLRSVLSATPGTDYVINAAGLTQAQIAETGEEVGDIAEDVNRHLPHRLAEAAQAVGARLIHMSTDGVFSGDAGPYDESATPDPNDLYSRTKLAGEVQASGVLNLRCSLIGPDPRKRRNLYEWFRNIPPGAVARGFVDQVWNGATTVQVAAVCEAVIESGVFDRLTAVSSVRHFCPNHPLSKYELLLHLRDALGSKAVVERAVSGHPLNRVLETRWKDLAGLIPCFHHWRQLTAELVNADPRGRLDASS